jgi:D-sedoheptulose 7-phosphate isomerase
MIDAIHRMLSESIQVKRALFDQAGVIEQIAARFIQTLRSGGTILLCGNGGSAADAQHVAGELVGRFRRERAAWPAIALTTNASIVTAIGNDYGFDRVFARQVEALARPGDVVVGISTSGDAMSVIRAMQVARERGCFTLGVTGQSGGRLIDTVDLCLRVPSDSTPRIQEAHIVVWHIVCELVEQALAADAA